MKLIIMSVFILISGMSTQSQANAEKVKLAVESLATCGNFIRFDNEYVYTGFGTYWTGSEQPRMPRPSVLKYISIDQLNEKQIVTSDSVIDVVRLDHLLFVLTYSGLEEWDLEKSTRLAFHKTYPSSEPFADDEHPRAFAKFENQLIIAHGRLGLSFFDLKTKRMIRNVSVVQSHLPLESTVNGVTVSGQYAYAVLDSYSIVGPREKPAFQGIVKVDMITEKVVSELDGMGSGAESITSDGKVAIVSFYGAPLVKYSLSKLQSTRLPSPTSRLLKFPAEGYPVGKAAMDDKYYYTCFSRAPGVGSTHVSRIPLVLDRRVLRLD